MRFDQSIISYLRAKSFQLFWEIWKKNISSLNFIIKNFLTHYHWSKIGTYFECDSFIYYYRRNSYRDTPSGTFQQDLSLSCNKLSANLIITNQPSFIKVLSNDVYSIYRVVHLSWQLGIIRNMKKCLRQNYPHRPKFTVFETENTEKEFHWLICPTVDPHIEKQTLHKTNAVVELLSD